MNARQVVLTGPNAVSVREVELPDPAPNQILVKTEASVVSAGTELAVYTGTHQWLKDPTLPDWKFPFRPGYSAAGTVVAKPHLRAVDVGVDGIAEAAVEGHDELGGDPPDARRHQPGHASNVRTARLSR